jgi:hypothetical protein
MFFSDAGGQLIEVMNAKRTSPRSKQRSSSKQRSTSAAAASQSTGSKTSRQGRTKATATQSSSAISNTLEGDLGEETPLSTMELLTNMTGLASQILGAMTTLTLQFQQQQEQQQQINQLLTQLIQVFKGEGTGELLARVQNPRSRVASGKDGFTVLNSQDLKKSHAKGSAEEKLRRAFQAIVTHNEVQGRLHAEKWAVNQNALAELTGCNRPAIKQFLLQYQADIKAHHQFHDISPRHNYAHGKVGTKIDDIIRW